MRGRRSGWPGPVPLLLGDAAGLDVEGRDVGASSWLPQAARSIRTNRTGKRTTSTNALILAVILLAGETFICYQIQALRPY